MESKNSSVTVKSGGTLFVLCVLTTLVFFVLKVTGFLAWSWVWILAPLWIYIGLSLAIGLLVLLGIGILLIIRGAGRNRNRSRRYGTTINRCGTPVPDSWWRS